MHVRKSAAEEQIPGDTRSTTPMEHPTDRIFCCKTDQIETPIGVMTIAVDAAGNLRAALFTADEEAIRRQLRLQIGKKDLVLKPTRNPRGLAKAISDYFAGDLGAIDRCRSRRAARHFNTRSGALCARFPAGRQLPTEDWRNHRAPDSGARGGTCQRSEPCSRCGSVPSRNWIKRLADRLWWRH